MAFNQRAAPGSDLNKPASRPSPSQARRPATLGTSASAAKPGLKSRPSLSSITNRKQDSPEDTQDKNKTAMNGSAKRAAASGPPRSTSPTKASLGRRSVLGSATNIETKPSTDRSSTASPLKPALKNTMPGARPSKRSVTPRSTRPIGYSPQSTPATKRLSSISASPASTRDESPSPASTDRPTLKAAKAERPKLLARKSTMSVTIEQRLREMELVNTMLRAAMAEDGDENDEVKEEYGKQADEELAKLRSKLEEARRTEGKAPLNIDANGINNDEAARVQPSSEISVLEAKLADSQQETSRLQSELSSLREPPIPEHETKDHQTSQDAAAEAGGNYQADLASRLEEINASHAQELAAAQKQVHDVEAVLQEKLESHVRDLEEAKRTAVTEGSQRATRLLDNQLQHHEAELGALQNDLTKEKLSRLDAAARAEQLGYDLLDLRNKADEERAELEVLRKELTKEKLSRIDASAKSEQLAYELLDLRYRSNEERERLTKSIERLEQQHAELSNEIEDIISSKDTAYNQLMNEMHSLQVRKDQQAAAATNTQTAAFASQLRDCHAKIQDLEFAATDRMCEFNTRISTYLHRIQELEIIAGKASADRDAVIQGKSEEITQMQAVIESLQDRFRDIHELKDREVETQRFQLSQEHDETVSKLRFEHEEELLKERNTGDQDTTTLVHKHGQELASLREESHKTTELFKQQIEDAQKSADAEAKRQIQHYQQALELSESQLEDTKSALLEAKGLMETLKTKLEETQTECEEAKAYGHESRDRFQRTHEKWTDLNRTVDSLEEERQNTIQEHSAAISKLKAELDATVNALNDKELELSAATDHHAALLRELESEQSRRIAELENAIEELQSENNDLVNRANRDHWTTIAELKSLHEKELSASQGELWTARTQFATDLEALKKAETLQRDQNAALQQQLQQAETVAEQRAMRVREAESALKVTKAELVELQTKRPNSSPFATSTPPPKASYRSSLWAVDENTPRRGENLGSSIMGNMAGMKEQVRQLENLNEDIISDQERICKKMSSLYSPEPLRWLDSTVEEEEEL